MFGWLTRNDGARKSRLKRRLKSPRGSVFSEFAIVMPIVLLMCSAIFELIGFWDAQVMANHAAWQVGRIAAVRGDDGMAFSDTVTKMSKTGVVSEKMPAPLQAMLKPFFTTLGKTIERFNDRGAITTMFLMSTCEIGYYGGSPSEELSEGVEKLVDAAVKGVVEDLPKWAEEFVTEKTDGWIPAGEGAIGQLVSNIINSIVNAAVQPIMTAIGKAIKDAANKLIELLNLDKLFSGGSCAARRARQFYGAAVRVAKAPTAVSKVSELEETDGPFVFADLSKMGRLAYPLVVDKGATSDGYFVTGAHGWPPNSQALKLVKVEVNWPYSRGWLFPVVSGYGKTSAPVVKGTSIAFPQPNIVDKNLWSTGAVAYVDGDYTNKMSNVYEQVIDDMKKYLALAQFGMKYRLNREGLRLVDEDPNPLHSYTKKHCDPLLALFGRNKGGDYATCWSEITDGKSQTALMRKLKPFFEESSYRGKNYFYWEGSWHRRYDAGMVGRRGLVYDYWGFGRWCQATLWACANESSDGRRCLSRDDFNMYAIPYTWQISAAGLKIDDLYNAYVRFGQRVGGFKLKDIVQWKDPSRYSSWYSIDQEAQATSMEKADTRFGKVINLLEEEINDIQKILDNKMDDYTGNNDDDFIIDPDDQEAIDDPKAAAAKAMERWKKRKTELRDMLRDIDVKISALNGAWWNYRYVAANLKDDRVDTVCEGMVRACIRACIETKGVGVLDDTSSFADVLRRKNLIEYDIVGKTIEFARLQEDYCTALGNSWDAELAYGVKLGLNSAKKAKKSGKSIDELDFDKDVIPDGSGGSLAPGSDSGWPIDGDSQSWSKSGGWR